MKKALYFVYVWPEPKSSAAGIRCHDIIATLQKDGWQITAVSSSQLSEHSQALKNVQTLSVPMNDSAHDSLLKAIAPDLIIYDRFVMEEQFGWKMRDFFPHACHIIDTQDLHSVRRARMQMVKKDFTFDKIQNLSPSDCGEDLLRELSSLYRVDGVLVVSQWEENYLQNALGFPRERILFSPLFASPENNPPPFAERKHLCFLGNYRHAPNLDGIEWFIETIWPQFHATHPQIELHLYGAYPPASISQRNKKMGIEAFGPIDGHRAMLKRYLALVAPLRFGAGIKGKILEAWSCGTPVLGTPIAFEGMGRELPLFCDQASFLTLFATMCEEEKNWQHEQSNAISHVKEFFSPEKRENELISFLSDCQKNLQHLRRNLTSQMLRHHSNNSTKYLSRWIEEKNKKLGHV